jgi:hypothetical protein
MVSFLSDPISPKLIGCVNIDIFLFRLAAFFLLVLLEQFFLNLLQTPLEDDEEDLPFDINFFGSELLPQPFQVLSRYSVSLPG